MLQQPLEYSEARGYNLGIARELGLEAAVTYNQLCFWQKTKPGEWFYKSYEEMMNELPLSKYHLRQAYTILEDRGFIEVAKFKVSGAPTLHFRIVKFLTMESKKTEHSMESKKTEHSINNKTPIKNIQNTPQVSEKEQLRVKQAFAVYELFIRGFKLPDGADLSDQAAIDRAKKRYKFTEKRMTAVKRRLDDAGFKMVCAAVVGFSRSEFHRGDNDRGWSADLAEYICRNYEQIEKGANLYERSKNKDQHDPWADL